MQQAIDFILQHLDLVATVVALVLVQILNNNWQVFKEIVQGVFLDVEKRAKEQVEKSGVEKMAEAIELIIGRLEVRLPAVSNLINFVAMLRGMTREQLIANLAQSIYDAARTHNARG